MKRDHIYISKGEFFGHPVDPSADTSRRRLELLGRRLAIPAMPQAGEGLPDIILRAIHRNGEEFTSGLWSYAFGKRKYDFNHRNYVDLDVTDQEFSDFLGTPGGADDISELRYSRQGAGVATFFGTTILLSQFARQRRVSPRFLGSNGYQKAIWSLSSLSFDPVNREFLIDRCPNQNCGAELTFNRTHGVCFCHACHEDLRKHLQPTVTLDNYENIAFACSLVDPELDPKRGVTRHLHPDLRTLNRGQVFEFIILVARLLDQETGRGFSHTVTPQSLDTAAASIHNWPRGIIDIAENVHDVLRCPTLTMGRGFKNAVWAEANACRHLFGLDFINALRDQLRAGLTAKNGRSKAPETRAQMFRRSHPRTAKEGGFALESRPDKLLYASIIARRSKGVRKDFKAAGLPFLELVEVYARKQASCPESDLLKLVGKAGRLPSLGTCLTQRSIPSQDNHLSLYKTAFAISDGKIAWTDIVKNVIDGVLEISVKESTEPLIRRLQVAHVGQLENIVAKSSSRRWSENVVLSNHEVGFYLGISEFEVSRLVTSGLLPTHGIQLSAVRQFLKRYICASEIISYLSLRGYSNRSVAATFSKVLKAGIEPVHARPAVRDRKAMRAYFRSIGY
ncbi:hypothetical protein AMC78_CH02534 [Rhizobium phaseoli]|uniref:hypothetical protein n=1 Tax=Rhizobium phaseoli TaxID=396 RepID=UPI0007F1491B|nr:hypothetical protein [Rhizobium phaseoli]ANM04621.1 hypothetical protein AMC78_CH02534 [Rhizobium phaseoli]